MKKITTVLIICIMLLSCGETNKKEATIEVTSENKTTETSKKEIKSTSNSTVLCKINGKDWDYTSGDGLVSRNSATKVRTATIGFRKQLEKGYESIQLEYDVDKNVLNNILVELKRPTKDGKIITVFYTLYANKLNRSPEASLSGTVTLSENERKASGTALFKIPITYEKDQLANTEDALIVVTDLNFAGIAYSDTDNLKKFIKK